MNPFTPVGPGAPAGQDQSTCNPVASAVPIMVTDNRIVTGFEPTTRIPESDYVVGSRLQLFRQNALLKDIAPEAYAAIGEAIKVVRFRPGEIIFAENDPGDRLYLIAEGAVKVSKKGRAGQQETLAHLMVGDFFGEMALIDSCKRSAQASAVGETVLGWIDRRGWDLLLRLAPHEAMQNFTRAVTQRLRHNNQHFIEQMMLNERLSLLGTTISSIVHDMNNPIGCILSACSMMATQAQDELAHQVTTIIRDSVKQMEMMTRELIDFSRGRTQLQIKPVPLSDLVEDLNPHFAKCRPFIEVKMEVNYDGILEIDRYRMIRVLGNLIRNAREAMGPNHGNQLLFSANRVDSNLRFVLTDTGPGIPADLVPQIFEPFFTHGKTDGTGLGLAISKAVVEAHRGTISVSSTDKGTSFQIDLPLEAAPA
jgi:signal transduction histidine kinase